MTVDELAKRTGIRKQYIEKIENGKAYGFSLHHLEKISDIFNNNLKAILKVL